MPTYPASPQLTVDALLRRPNLISRNLTDLTSKRFVADQIFSRGSSDSVAGGAAQYQRSEVIYTDRDPEEVGLRAGFPRAGWSEAVLTALVRKYGLEVPLSFEAVRRNQIDQIARAQRKLANAVVKFVDTKAMALLTSDPAVLTMAASADWTTAATDIVADIAAARKMIADQDEGYDADTLVVNPAQELDLIVDKDIRDAMPREGGQPNPSIITGRAVPVLGLSQVLVTPQLAAGTVLLLNSKVVGTIADEAVDPREGYATYNPGPNFAPILTKVYQTVERDEFIVRAARFPAMWLSEPKAAVKITGA